MPWLKTRKPNSHLFSSEWKSFAFSGSVSLTFDAWHLQAFFYFNVLKIDERVKVGSIFLQKSVKLQYITLGCLDDETNESLPVPSIIFSYTFFRLRALKTLYFYFCNFIRKIKKINWKDFWKEYFKKSWQKNNAWNIRRLVDDLFVQSSKQPSVI